MRDNNMLWDFGTLSSESAHQVTFLMSDGGTPRTLRDMNGYGSHTLVSVNAGGERFWVKHQFKTEQGVANFTDANAKAMVAEDPDFHRRDSSLRSSSQCSSPPTWSGMAPSPDQMLQGRLFSYHDAHRHRIGSNYLQLPVNQPRVPVHGYNKDGPSVTTTPVTNRSTPPTATAALPPTGAVL